ncbi:MAG: radical SAM protein [Candidatus Omnitrophota bacterium]
MEKLNILLTRARKKRKFKVHDTWIYVTERCNLRCDYCFFKHKHGRDISLEAVKQLFLLFEREETVPATLIFSGGEPLLAKDKLFSILSEAHRRFKGISLHIQTNGSLIDQASIEKFRRWKVSLEFGIDGSSEQTIKHRCGLKSTSFKRLTDNISMCLKAGISCGCTMTVHPQEVRYMDQGLDFLQKMGIPHVDITPAAFMSWSAEMVAFFKRKYLALARRPEYRRVMYANEDNEWIGPGVMDLSLHPPGYLLGGDPFLCLPENKRIEFNLWDPTNGKVKPKVLSFYQDAYDRMRQQKDRILYREYVGHSFKLINTMMGEEYMNTAAINDILRFLTRTHLTLGIKKYGK